MPMRIWSAYRPLRRAQVIDTAEFRTLLQGT